MKNKNLSDALRKLDHEYLEALPSVPAEELYYSPEYEKKIDRLLGKKKERKAFSWKHLIKQAGAFALGAAFAASIALIFPIGTPAKAEENPIWQYDVVDFVDTHYTVHSPVTTLAATENGYTKGTYEYDYLTILSEISFYTAVVEQYIIRSANVGNEEIQGFLEYVDQDDITKPYDDIILHAFELLNACGFAPAELTMDVLWEYWWSLPYEKSRNSVTSFVGLSLGNVHEKLTENANALLSLTTKYPNYHGDFLVSDYVCERAEKLIEACKPVYANKTEHMEKWLAYYATVEPTLVVTEEFIRELDAVKITITGNGRYQLPGLAKRYIENDDGADKDGHVITLDAKYAKETLTVYLPVSSYFGQNGAVQDLEIAKYDENGKYFEDEYVLTLDPAEYYSDAPITMNNRQLDGILHGYFGEHYSEKDLLNVQEITVQYFEYADYPTNPPQMTLRIWNGMRDVYLYCTLDLAGAESEEIFIAELAEDLRHFHGLRACITNGDADRLISTELKKELYPYCINPEMALAQGAPEEIYS